MPSTMALMTSFDKPQAPQRHRVPLIRDQRRTATRFDEAYALRYNRDRFAPIAQRIAQLPSKQWVVGSNPTGGAFTRGKEQLF